jgi:hypothetical protein
MKVKQKIGSQAKRTRKASIHNAYVRIKTLGKTGKHAFASANSDYRAAVAARARGDFDIDPDLARAEAMAAVARTNRCLLSPNSYAAHMWYMQ